MALPSTIEAIGSSPSLLFGGPQVGQAAALEEEAGVRVRRVTDDGDTGSRRPREVDEDSELLLSGQFGLGMRLGGSLIDEVATSARMLRQNDQGMFGGCAWGEFSSRVGAMYEEQSNAEVVTTSNSSSSSCAQSNAGGWTQTPTSIRASALFGGDVTTASMWGNPACEGAEQQLFVGGISRQTYEAQLREHFSQFGTLSEVVVMRHKKTGISRCFGFISYRSTEAVDAALRFEHRLDGRRVEVKRAVPRHLLPGPGLRSAENPPSLFGAGDARTMVLGSPAALGDVAAYYGLGTKAAALAFATRRARERVLLPAWNQKLRRKYREEMRELQFQMAYKYETWGYPTPEAFFSAEFPGRSQLDVFATKAPEAAALEPPQERRLQQLAGEVLDFNQDVLLGRRALSEECYLRPLDDLWRKAMTFVCDDLNDLVRSRRVGGQTETYRLTLTHGDSAGTGARRSRKGKSIILKFLNQQLNQTDAHLEPTPVPESAPFPPTTASFPSGLGPLTLQPFFAPDAGLVDFATLC